MAQDPVYQQAFPEIFGGQFVSTPAANTAAVVTLVPQGPTAAWVVASIFYSYAGAGNLGTGNLTIVDTAGFTVFGQDIPLLGAFTVNFTPPKRTGVGIGCTITLAAAGGSVAGKLSVDCYVRAQVPLGNNSLNFSLPQNSGYIPLISH